MSTAWVPPLAGQHSRRASRNPRARTYIAYDRAPEPYQRSVAYRQVVSDGGAAANITVAPYFHMTGDCDIRANQGELTDRRIVVHDGVWEQTYVIGDRDVTGDDDTRHDEQVASELRERRDSRRWMHNLGKSLYRQRSEAVDDGTSLPV